MMQVAIPSGDYAGDTIFYCQNKLILKSRVYGSVLNIGN